MILACAGSGRDADAGPLVRELHGLAPVPGRWNVRLSVEAPVTCADPDSLSLESLRCDSADVPNRQLTQLAAIAGRATKAMEADVDVDALHAATIIDLLVADTTGKALDRSITRLEMLTRLERRRATAWLDLSAAYLMRASARGEGRDLVAALDASTRALEFDSTSAGASYNRALALDLMALDFEAAREWTRFLRLNPRSKLVAFARDRLNATSSVRQPVTPTMDSPPDSLRAFVTRHSYEARLFAWDVLLGGWGEATLAHDSVLASKRLEAATVIGSDLANRYGDSSLVLAIASIGTSSEHGARRQVAQAHATFSSGRAKTRAENHAGAERDFVAILSNKAASPALRDWTTLAHANSLVYLQKPQDAEREAARLLQLLDERSHPSVAGRAWLMIGVLAFRSGRDDEGLSATAKARRFFEFAGEQENAAWLSGLLGERALRNGNDEGFTTVIEGLRRLRSFPLGQWRHNSLYTVGSYATRIGLDRAAMASVDEDAATAGRNRAFGVAEMRLVRARSLWESGDTARAREALSLASTAIDSLPTQTLRDFFHSELTFTLATGPMARNGERALAMLDTVITYNLPARRASKLIPAFIGRAGAALALGRTDVAEADLAQAAGLYDQQRESITSLPDRAAVLARGRDVFQHLALLRVGRDDVVGGLEALERGRLSFTDVAGPQRTRRGQVADDLVLNYALIGDTLVTWTVHRESISATRVPVIRDSLLEVVEQVRVAMELQSAESSVRPALTKLYDWLVRPIEGHLPADSSTIAIVSDPALAEVPYAALFDSSRAAYFVEQKPLRWAPTLADARKTAQARLVSRALVVSAPALDHRVFPGLAPLPGAAHESKSVASFFTAPVTFDGHQADSTSVATALQSVQHFHFAGHAVFDDARPDRSRLAMMPRGLDATAIAKLDLRKLRLAVLSACETLRAPERRGAGFAGLAEAFLAGGADGVVGTLWSVDDQHTREFMGEFYRAYRDRDDAAVALRQAQLRMMQSSGESRRPSAWAGFRLAGR